MTAVTDHRVRFYLEHEEQIQTWAGLARLASTEAHEFLLECCREIRDGAESLSPNLKLLIQDRASYPGIYLFRQSWEKEAERPRVSVSLEWPGRSKVTFSKTNPAYVGIKVDRNLKGGVDLAKWIHKNLADEFKQNGFLLGATTSYWPGYRPESAPEDRYWEDLTPYKQRILTSVRETWSLFCDHIDKALQGSAGGG